MDFQLTNWLKDLLSPKLLTTCQVDISCYFNSHVLLSNFATAAANAIFGLCLTNLVLQSYSQKRTTEISAAVFTREMPLQSSNQQHQSTEECQSIYNYKMSSAPGCSPYTTSYRHAENPRLNSRMQSKILWHEDTRCDTEEKLTRLSGVWDHQGRRCRGVVDRCVAARSVHIYSVTHASKTT